jgi:membrane protein DedA with SNARE-associated domain
MDGIIQGLLTNISHISPWIIYLWFFISAILQITVPPYPGDTILIIGGYMGGAGIESSISILISYVLGTIISSLGLYVLGVKKGDAVLRFKLVEKYFSTVYQNKAKRWLIKYGIILFFICKFIPGLNSLIIIFGGILRYNPLWACIGVGLASLIHNIIFFLIGRSIGNNMEIIKSFLSAYNTVAIMILVLVMVIYFIYNICKARNKFKR